MERHKGNQFRGGVDGAALGAGREEVEFIFTEVGEVRLENGGRFRGRHFRCLVVFVVGAFCVCKKVSDFVCVGREKGTQAKDLKVGLVKNIPETGGGPSLLGK